MIDKAQLKCLRFQILWLDFVCHKRAWTDKSTNDTALVKVMISECLKETTLASHPGTLTERGGSTCTLYQMQRKIDRWGFECLKYDH